MTKRISLTVAWPYFRCAIASRNLLKYSSIIARNMAINRFHPGPPAKVGDTLEQIDTPCLIVDLDRFEKNLTTLPKLLDNKVRLRPHYKTHKSPEIAQLQLQHGGAIGICCAKLTEVESLVLGSHSDKPWDILMTNQIPSTSQPKLNRIVNVAKKLQENPQSAPLGIAVDHVDQIEKLGELVKSNGFKLDIYIELNVGQDRCGVQSGAEALPLYHAIQKNMPQLKYKGVLAYNGSNQHNRTASERKDTVEGPLVAGRVKEYLRVLNKEGIETEIITGGGTGSFSYEMGSGLYNEVQPGSYLFMDADYNANLSEKGDHHHPFVSSLFLLTRIQSQGPAWYIVDAGLKAQSQDSGPPQVINDKFEPMPIKYSQLGDEHGKLVPEAPTHNLKTGEIVRLIPGHCDPTVNMHDYLVGVRDGFVETVWPIEGRGPGY